jgi:hypothetical protein
MSTETPPTPWEAHENHGHGWEIGTAQATPYCTFIVGVRDEAVAKRIVACVNACAGVPTEVLTAHQAGGLPWSVADQIDQRVKLTQLRGLAAVATCQARDLANGWPESQLCQPLSQTFDSLDRLFPGHEVERP